MRSGKTHVFIAFGTLIFIILLLAACAAEQNGTPAPQRNSFPVDRFFQGFYQALGGEEVLGPAISQVETRGALKCQFAERALLCLNPSLTDENRFSLYPLGRDLNIQPEIPAGSSDPNARVVDGYVIYEKFVPLYDQLYGARYTGKPLTEIRINQDLQRIEQFFENVGFSQSLNDPEGPVSLIPYGAYLCGGGCSYKLNEYWSIVKSSTVEQPFAPVIARLGGVDVSGPLLLNPQIADDGNLQQVYENVVFYAPPDDLSQVALRPLPILLGYQVYPLEAMFNHEQLVFYEVENGLGHNVPKPFDTFIAEHGGRDLAGEPISEVMKLPDQPLYQQCFENYCLLYDPSAEDGHKVRLAPLGAEYLKRSSPNETNQIHNVFSPEHISLLVSADKPTLSENEDQFIRMLVQNKETGQGVERVEGTLVLNYPDRPPVRFTFPPTDAGGMSVLKIPPVSGLANGSRVAYQVCLNLPSEQANCVTESYLIWSIP